MAETVQITMPQMGESVSEGTVLTWHKQEGDWVDKDETIVEVSTDKVDAEVPAPAAGKLVKILAQEDETVEVGQPLAELELERGGAAAARTAAAAERRGAAAAERRPAQRPLRRPRPPRRRRAVAERRAQSRPSRAASRPRTASTSRR